MERARVWLFLGAWFAAQAFVPLAHGQTQVAKLTASDGAPFDLFGTSVSVSGATALVGANWHSNLRGAAYVFERDVGGADNWGQVRKLTAPDGVPGDQFGCSACLSADVAIVGAYGSSGGADTGAAYVFQRDWGGPDNWGFVRKLAAADGAPDDLFSFSVAVSGDTALVGAYTKNLAGERSGAAYVFDRNSGGPDNWGQVRQLQPEDAAPFRYFGVSVRLSAGTAIIGAYWQTDLPGQAYIFERDAGGPNNWGQVAAFAPQTLDAFGYAVGIDADTAVVGAYANSDHGAGNGKAYVFRRNEGGPDAWGQAAGLYAQDAGRLFLGWSVAASGQTILGGAPARSWDRGAAYVFRPGTDPGVWEQVSQLVATDGALGDLFGYSVSLSGNTAVIGAQGDDDQGDFSGSAYVFYLPGLPGDLNCDGVVDFDDINPFVLALSDPAGYAAAYPNCDILNGDCDQDGDVDFDDIDPFVALLSGKG